MIQYSREHSMYTEKLETKVYAHKYHHLQTSGADVWQHLHAPQETTAHCSVHTLIRAAFLLNTSKKTCDYVVYPMYIFFKPEEDSFICLF